MFTLFTNRRMTHLSFVDTFEWIWNTAEILDSIGTILRYIGTISEYHTLPRGYMLMFVNLLN
jgi:hypothetical protein